MTQLASPSSRQAGDAWPITRDIYRRMVDAGMLEGQRVELIRGRIINMAPMGLPHDLSLMKTGRALRRVFPEDRFTVRTQQQFTAAGQSDPEPDLCVVSGPIEAITDYPHSALLIIEISETSLSYDRRVKGPLYAESGVQDYWIINLVDNVVEVYRQPHAVAGGEHAYAPAIVKRPGEPIDVLALPGVSVMPEDLLP